MGWVTQPSCSCPRHNNAITAEAWRPCGYLAISLFAHSALSALKAKPAGCMSGGARRRSMESLFREIDAGDQPVAEGINGDDLEFFAAGRAHHFLMVHHRVADRDAAFQISLVLRKLSEGLGIASLNRV